MHLATGRENRARLKERSCIGRRLLKQPLIFFNILMLSERLYRASRMFPSNQKTHASYNNVALKL